MAKWKTVKIITVIKLSSLKAVQKPTIDSKSELRSAVEDLIEKLTQLRRIIIFVIAESKEKNC